MPNTHLFDDDLLSAYADQFYGYGDYNGDYWFIGMEEGGGGSFDEVERKFDIWHKRGRKAIEDLGGFHGDIGEHRWFKPRPLIQSTWGPLVRILLAAQGEVPFLDMVRDYQSDEFGRLGGDVCSLELLPLPSPSIGKWYYDSRSNLRMLADRKAYTKYFAPLRSSQIRASVLQYKPRVVVFYSTGYIFWWNQIAGVALVEMALMGRRCLVGHSDTSLFVVTQHPCCPGVSNAYYHAVGKLIRQRCGL